MRLLLVFTDALSVSTQGKGKHHVVASGREGERERGVGGSLVGMTNKTVTRVTGPLCRARDVCP